MGAHKVGPEPIQEPRRCCIVIGDAGMQPEQTYRIGAPEPRRELEGNSKKRPAGITQQNCTVEPTWQQPKIFQGAKTRRESIWKRDPKLGSPRQQGGLGTAGLDDRLGHCHRRQGQQQRLKLVGKQPQPRRLHVVEQLLPRAHREVGHRLEHSPYIGIIPSHRVLGIPRRHLDPKLIEGT